MLNVSGQFVLQSVVDETLPTKAGGTWRKVELVGHVATGWPSTLPQSLDVVVSPNKNAVESLGDVRMIQPGTTIQVEGYIKGRAHNGRVFVNVVATKAAVSAGRPVQVPVGVQHQPTAYVPPQSTPTPVQDLDGVPF